MKQFSNYEYRELIGELIGEANYMNISNRSKLARLRDFSEILVRKMLNIGNDTQIMLGDVKTSSSKKNININQCLANIDNNLKKFFLDSVDKINKATRNAHHTKETRCYSDFDVLSVEEDIFDLYSMLFIQYFIDIKIDINTESEILTTFSLLPPIIRYKTWNYLYKTDPNNIQVVDKLCLSIIKVYNKQKAINWLLTNKKKINSIPYPSRLEIQKYKLFHADKFNPNMCRITLDFESYNNLYDLLLDKINNPKTSINEHGKMYSSFEEAKKYFDMLRNSYPNKSKNLNRLYDLMEFVYIGRKSI